MSHRRKEHLTNGVHRTTPSCKVFFCSMAHFRKEDQEFKEKEDVVTEEHLTNGVHLVRCSSVRKTNSWTAKQHHLLIVGAVRYWRSAVQNTMKFFSSTEEVLFRTPRSSFLRLLFWNEPSNNGVLLFRRTPLNNSFSFLILLRWCSSEQKNTIVRYTNRRAPSTTFKQLTTNNYGVVHIEQKVLFCCSETPPTLFLLTKTMLLFCFSRN